MRIVRWLVLSAAVLACGCATDAGQKPTGDAGEPPSAMPPPIPLPVATARPQKSAVAPPRSVEQAAQSARELKPPAIVALRETDAGRMLDNQDMLLAIKAEREAMVRGKASWTNQDNGRSGSVFGVQEYETQGRRCRSFLHEFVVDGSRRSVQRNVCARNGEWIIDS